MLLHYMLHYIHFMQYDQFDNVTLNYHNLSFFLKVSLFSFQNIKRRSHVSVELFGRLKEKYFSPSGNFSLPEHLLDAAQKCIPQGIDESCEEKGSFNVIFSLYMQQVYQQFISLFSH